MKPDITNRSDIKNLIDNFYAKVKVDPLIGFFFDKVIPVNWDKHLPLMVDFWENIVFQNGSYEGNPMAQHQHLHALSPMKMDHFQRWTKLFNESVDELFEGEKAIYIKQRALSIATVMQIKIFS